MGRNRKGNRQNQVAAHLREGRFGQNQTNDRQLALELMYRRVLGELAMNRFEWKGFEDTGVDIRYLEYLLYTQALSVFFKDEYIRGTDGDIRVGTGQFLALQGAGTGFTNFVNNPTEFALSGPNFQGVTIRADQCVPIWANYFRQPDLDIVYIYANKLAEIDRTIEINSLNARLTTMLQANENQSMTAINLLDMVERGERVVKARMPLGEMFSVLDLGVDPKNIETLSVVRSRIWNECMGLLGINNSNQDKKERLVESEVGANNDQVNTARRVNLNTRQMAAEQINAKYGLDVSVDYYSNLPVETVNPLTNEQSGTV